MYIYAAKNDFRDFSPENLPHKSGPADGTGKSCPSAGIFGGPGLSRGKGAPRAVPVLLAASAPGTGCGGCVFPLGKFRGPAPFPAAYLQRMNPAPASFLKKRIKQGFLAAKRNYFSAYFPGFGRAPDQTLQNGGWKNSFAPFGAQEVDGCAACWKSRKIAGFPSKFVHYPKLARNV